MTDRRLTRKELAKQNKKQSNKRKVIRIFIILLITSTLVYATDLYGSSLAYLGDFISNMQVLVKFGDGWPLEQPIIGYKQSKEMGNSLALLDKDCLNVYSPTAKKVFAYQHTMQDPVMDTSNTRSILYNPNQTTLQVLNSYKILFTQEMTHDIIHADISNNNKIAVLTKSLNYNGEVTVFNYNMKESFTWYCAKGYPVYSKLSNQGKTLAVNTLFTQEGGLNSNIYIIDAAKGKESFVISNEEYALDVIFMDENNIAVIYTNQIHIWNLKTKEKTATYSYNGDNLLAADVSGTSIALALGGYGKQGDNRVVLLSPLLEENICIDVSDAINTILLYQSRIYIMCESNLYEYNFKGELLTKLDVDVSAKDLVEFGGVIKVDSHGLYKLEKTLK